MAAPQKKINFIQIIQIVLIIGFVLLLMDLNTRLTGMYRLSNQQHRLETEVIQMTATEQGLVLELTRVNSDPVVVDWAHRYGKMIREGERLVVPLSAGHSTPTPQPVATITPEPVVKWQVWQALFFGQ